MRGLGQSKALPLVGMITRGISDYSAMYQLEIAQFFEAAHQLPDSQSLLTKKCCNLHGHTYLAQVSIYSEKLVDDMVVDFKAIKECINVLDHKFINDIFKAEGIGDAPTAENIARYLAEKITREAGLGRDFKSVLVKLYEGYKGENSASISYTAHF